EHGRALDDVAGAEPSPVVRRRVAPLTEVRASGAAARAFRPGAGGDVPQPRAPDRPDAGDPEVHPLDLLTRVVGEVVAVLRTEPPVERVGDHGRVEWSLGHLDAHLERLPEVAQVGG